MFYRTLSTIMVMLVAAIAVCMVYYKIVACSSISARDLYVHYHLISELFIAEF